jgi:hypothetical protein
MLSVIADLCSLAGFAGTVYVAIKVWRIERAYITQALVDECLPKLKAVSKNLKGAIGRGDENQILAELNRAKAILSGILSYAENQEEARHAISEVSRIANCRGSQLRSNVGSAMHIIIAESERLSLLRIRLQWSSKNG